MFFACLFVLIFASHASANNLVDVTPSDEEMQQLRSEIVAEYIAKNPDAVLEIPYTAEQMEEALREKNAIINEVNNKTDGNALNTTNRYVRGHLICFSALLAIRATEKGFVQLDKA